MGKKIQQHDRKRKAKNQATIKTQNKHSKKNIDQDFRQKIMTRKFSKSRGCSCDINQTRLKK